MYMLFLVYWLTHHTHTFVVASFRTFEYAFEINSAAYVYVCMHAWIYVCIVYELCMHVCMHGLMYVICMYVCKYVCMIPLQ